MELVGEEPETPQPPDPPPMDRRVRFRPLQAIGVPIIALIPVLALLGLLGDGEGTQRVTEGLEVEVTWPTDTRFRALENVTVTVTNPSGTAVEDVVVGVSADYLEAWSNVFFTPQATAIVEGEYRVSLGRLTAGQTARVTVDAEALQYGLHDGAVMVRSDAGEVSVAVRTLVLP